MSRFTKSFIYPFLIVLQSKKQKMLLYTSISIFLLALVLYFNNYKTNKTAIYLSLFLMLFSLYYATHYLVLFGQDKFWLALFYNHFTPLYLLLGPLLLFYTRGVINNSSRLEKRDIWHFIPAIIHAIGIIPFVLLPFEIKLKNAELLIANVGTLTNENINLFFNLKQRFFIRIGAFIIYTAYCGYLVFKAIFQKQEENTSIKKNFSIQLRWLSILLTCSLVIAIYFLLITIIFINKSPKDVYSNSYNLHLIGSITFFVLAFSLLLFPNILYGVPRKIYLKELKTKKRKEVTQDLSASDYNCDPLYELSEKIKIFLEEEKPYLDPYFSISYISNTLQVPENHVSYCFNIIFNTTFYKMRADLRVNHAINLLKTEAKERLTIEAIGEQSGFKTRSNFYTIFKESTGMTPREFISVNTI